MIVSKALNLRIKAQNKINLPANGKKITKKLLPKYFYSGKPFIAAS